jgi:hypothetical protein
LQLFVVDTLQSSAAATSTFKSWLRITQQPEGIVVAEGSWVATVATASEDDKDSEDTVLEGSALCDNFDSIDWSCLPKYM